MVMICRSITTELGDLDECRMSEVVQLISNLTSKYHKKILSSLYILFY